MFTHIAETPATGREVVQRIVEAVHPEKIICYRTRKLYSNKRPDDNQFTTVLNLLIVIQDGDNIKGRSVSDTIERLSDQHIRIIPLIQNKLRHGTSFVQSVYEKGVLLYDQNNPESLNDASKQRSKNKFITTYDVHPFEYLAVDIHADVILQRGSKESIEIESPDNLVNHLRVYVENKRLWISSDKDLSESASSLIRIIYSSLTGIAIHQASSLTCREAITGNHLSVVQNDGANVNLDVEVSALDVTLTNNSSMKVSGSADTVQVLNSGEGSFHGLDLRSSVAKVIIRNTGDIAVQVDDELNAVIEGDGNLQMKGEPGVRRFKVG